MTEDDLATIEAKLAISLPNDYRELMLSRAAQLIGSDGFEDDLSPLFLDADAIISINRIERSPDSGTGYAFPKWWQTFFLIGTNGAGDYYCLKLDNEPGVWTIGSDCGDEPVVISTTLQEFVEATVDEFGNPEACQEWMGEQVQTLAEDGDDLVDKEPLGEFTWKHRTIASEEITQRMRALGVNPIDDAAAFGFAQWLEDRGDHAWARYIRARCALDGKVPDDDPNSYEQLLECALGLSPGTADYGDFHFWGNTDANPWWEDKSDDFEMGLPSLVTAEPGSAVRLIQGLDALVCTTPCARHRLRMALPGTNETNTELA